MSETVHYRGTLTIVQCINRETLEEQCRRILGNAELETYNDSYQEQLLSDNYEDYVILNNILYSVEKKDIGDDDIFIMTNGENETLNFEVRYYNGGCSFDEAIKAAFSNKI